MKRFRFWLALLLCAGLLPGIAGAALVVDEDSREHYTLPVDFAPGMPVDEKFFLAPMEYEDPTLRCTIETSVVNQVSVWVADIEIADASQLRTASADGFDSDGLAPADRMARRMNAVIAINGDYFSYKGREIVIRQGVQYLNHLSGRRDVLVIDEDGDFHGLLAPEAGEVGTEIDGKRIINAFAFGPLLVNNGRMREGGYSGAMSDDARAQRMAIAQTGHLKYRVICCGPLNGETKGAKGMTLEEFRAYIAGMPEVQTAYNLDGGDSTYLILNGRKVNYVENPFARDVADIIYFASAYPGN